MGPEPAEREAKRSKGLKRQNKDPEGTRGIYLMRVGIRGKWNMRFKGWTRGGFVWIM